MEKGPKSMDATRPRIRKKRRGRMDCNCFKQFTSCLIFRRTVDGVIIQELVTESNPQVMEGKEGRGTANRIFLEFSQGSSCCGKYRTEGCPKILHSRKVSVTV